MASQQPRSPRPKMCPLWYVSQHASAGIAGRNCAAHTVRRASELGAGVDQTAPVERGAISSVYAL